MFYDQSCLGFLVTALSASAEAEGLIPYPFIPLEIPSTFDIKNALRAFLSSFSLFLEVGGLSLRFGNGSPFVYQIMLIKN